nr:MAG TPA: hypothetical protein [Caudoviricetes sp.]
MIQSGIKACFLFQKENFLYRIKLSEEYGQHRNETA